MLIELRWLDGNKSKKHSTEIWRATAPFTDTVDAELIATTAPGVTTYADTAVIQGQKYYYRFRNIFGGLKSPMSKLFEFEANQYTGPGPQRTTFGDEHFGYYGVFPEDPTIVPTINQVREAFGLEPVLGTGVNTQVHKFAIGGTIRGLHSTPLARGNEISLSNPLLKPLLEGGYTTITLGLHTWAVILPSTGHSQNVEPTVQHFPGELRSMLGVISDMYSRVEDATTGNNTGNRLLPATGQISFFDTLSNRWTFEEIKWIVSSDWEGNVATVINWTSPFPVAPEQPMELHVEEVDYSFPTNWQKTIIWPVLIYTGLVGPT